MSYKLKYFCIHKTQVEGHETEARIEILQLGYEGLPVEIIGVGDVYEKEYEQLDSNDVFRNPVQKSSFDFHWDIQDETDLAALVEIDESQEGQFMLRQLIDGVEVWEGTVLPGLLNYSEGPYPLPATVTAKDLTILEGEQTDTTGFFWFTIINEIARILKKTRIEKNIKVYSNWEYIDKAGDDYVNLIEMNRGSLRDFNAENRTDDSPITDLEALERICRAHNLILRQGKDWILTHISALEDPENIQEYVYDIDGNQIASGVEDITVHVDRDKRFVLPSSDNSFITPLKSTEHIYNHRTKTGDMELPSLIRLKQEDTQGRSFEQPFIQSLQGQSINLAAEVLATSQTRGNARAQLTIRAGEKWFTKNSGWVDSPQDYIEPLSLAGPTEDVEVFSYAGRINISTAEIPDDLGGDDLEITFKRVWIFDPDDGVGSEFAPETIYSEIDFSITRDAEAADSTGILNRLAQEGGFHRRYDHRQIFFGDGPSPTSPGRFTYRDSEDFRQSTVTRWRFRGGDQEWGFARLHLEEQMRLLRRRVRRLNADLWGQYLPDNVLSYDNKFWFFRGGRQTGRENTWSARFIQPVFVSQLDDFSSGLRGVSGSGSSGVSVTRGLNDVVSQLGAYASSQRLTVTSADVSGAEITEIPIEPIGSGVLSIDTPVYLFNPFDLRFEEFIIAADQQAADEVLTVQQKDVSGTIPAGSWVISTGTSINAGIITSRFATRIFSNLFGVGMLTQDVSGTVDSVPVNLYTQVREGQTFGVPVATRPTPYYISVRRESSYEGEELQTFGPGLVNLPVRSTVVNAPAESIITLSGTQLQAYFHVDPGRIVGNVEKERTAEAIGALAEDRSGTITNIALKEIDEPVDLIDGQILRIYNKQGDNEAVEVDGDQTVTPSTHTVNIVQKELAHSYVAGFAWLKEPSYKQTGRLTIEAGKINLNTQAITDQGTSISGLELDVNDLNSATATLFTRVENTEDDITTLSSAQLQLESNLDSATATLTAQFNSLSDDLDTETQARLQLESDMNSATATLTAQFNTVSDDLDDLDTKTASLILQVGDIEDDLYASGGIEDQIGTIGSRAVLQTDDNGNIAVLELLSGSTGSFAGMDADFILLNNWEFVRSTGVMRSTTQINGNDAIRLNGTSGLAEFENVKVRGTLTTVNLETEMEVEGAIYLPDSNDPDIIISPEDGIRIAGGTGPGRAIRFSVDSGITSNQATISGSSNQLSISSPGEMVISSNAQLQFLFQEFRMPSISATEPGVAQAVYYKLHQNLGFNDRVLVITD